MDKNKFQNTREEKGDPKKVFREELNDSSIKKMGSGISDTDAETAARDKAKALKANQGKGQKMDGLHESELREMDDE